MSIYFTGVPFTSVYLICTYLTDIHLIGIHLVGIYLMDGYLTSIHLTSVSYTSWTYIFTGVYLMNVYFTSGVYVRQRRQSLPRIRCSCFIQSCVHIRDFWWLQAWYRISHFALNGNFGGFSLGPSAFMPQVHISISLESVLPLLY
jgi:hypothetical protein